MRVGIGVLAIQCSSAVSLDESRDGVGRTESGSASWVTAICAPRTRCARACARWDRCAHVQRHGQRGWVEGWCRQDREWKCELDHCDLRSEYSSRESMRASGSMCACTAAWSVRMSWVGVLAIQCSSRVSVDGSRDGVGRTESGSASWITAICAPRTRRARPCARRDRCAHVQRHGQRG